MRTLLGFGVAAFIGGTASGGGTLSGAADGAHAALLLDAGGVGLSMLREPAIKVSLQTQFQYSLNLRDDDSGALADPDDDTTLGFQMRRTRVNLAGRVSDSIKGKVQIDFNAGTGEATLFEAYADWAVGDRVSLRIGQQKVRFLREDLVGTTRMLTADVSVQNRVFGQGYSQMLEAGYAADAWRGWLAVSDGFDSLNTPFDGADEADTAVTARAEVKFGDAAWSAHDQYTSWRGAASGGMLGLAGHFQSGGATNPGTPDDQTLLAVTADFGWVGDGWNAYAAGVWRQTDDGAGEFDDFGLLAQAGVFVTDRVELFARWDGVFVDSGRGPGVEDFHTLTAGFNYYLVPESHAAKLTVNLLYYLDAVNETGGVVAPSAGANLLADTEDGQIGVTAQLQLLF